MSLFAFPVNLLVLAAIVAAAVLTVMSSRRKGEKTIFATAAMAVFSMAIAAIVAFLPALGIIARGFFKSPLFMSVELFFLFVLACAVVDRLVRPKGSLLRTIVFTALHFGVFLSVSASLFGRFDAESLRMEARRDSFSEEAFIRPGMARRIPFEVRLDSFSVEYYKSGIPSDYEAIITLSGSKETRNASLKVNHPVHFEGYDIYLGDYDTKAGSNSQWCSLLLEKEPWKGTVALGIWIVLLGSLLSLFTLKRMKGGRWTLLVVAAGALIYIVFILMRTSITSGELVPALQSGWFVPHIVAFMFSYALLGASAVLATVISCGKKEELLPVLDRLVTAGVAFFSFGMLMGALWAKAAWAHYWSWDPKETWSMITWFNFLIYLHLRRSGKNKPQVACLVVIIAFLTLQMCWWGVNLLPSASESVHTYIN